MNTASLHHRGDRRGFVIPAAIVAMVIISLLALTGLYIAQNDVTANVGLSNSWKALYAADAGAQQVLLNWKAGGFSSLNPGDSSVTAWRTLDDGSTYRTTVKRVDDGAAGAKLYRLRTVGRPGDGITAQRVIFTMVNSLTPENVCCEGAVKMQGTLNLHGTANKVKMSGLDTDPPGWGGRCPSRSDVPGLLIEDEADLYKSGKPKIVGAPPVQEDTTIDNDDFVDFDGMTYSDLAAMADKRFIGDQNFSGLGPVVSGGICQTDVASNWGDPLDSSSPCFDYLPIIHVQGNLTITGNGYGQGLVLVDGDFDMGGSSEFYGVIIVQGDADVHGNVDIVGGMLLRNGPIGGNASHIRGNSKVQYSGCAASVALSNAASTREMAGRHWFEVVD